MLGLIGFLGNGVNRAVLLVGALVAGALFFYVKGSNAQRHKETTRRLDAMVKRKETKTHVEHHLRESPDDLRDLLRGRGYDRLHKAR